LNLVVVVFCSVDSGKKLTLLYLANDVIQNGKKKGSEFKTEFSKVLPRALQFMSQEKDESFRKSVERVISVWEERKVFEPDTIVRFKSMLGKHFQLGPSSDVC
jgi:regulator of Ty1 transposition protein 103